MLVLTRKLGENIRIGDSVKITVLEVRSGQVKLGIEAPPEVKVHREEIYARIQEENRRAQRRKAETATGTGAAVEAEGKEPSGPAECRPVRGIPDPDAAAPRAGHRARPRHRAPAPA